MASIEINQWLQDAIVKNLISIVEKEVGEPPSRVNFESAEYGVITLNCERSGRYSYEYECKTKSFTYREALRLYLKGEDDE